MKESLREKRKGGVKRAAAEGGDKGEDSVATALAEKKKKVQAALQSLSNIEDF